MANSVKETAEPSSAVGCAANSHSAYSFRFVDVGKPSQTSDEDSRSLIRSHVMRDFYDRRDNRRRPSTQPERTSAASRKEGVTQQTHRFKVGPQGLQEIKKRRRKRDIVAETPIPTPSITTPIHAPRQSQKQIHKDVPDLHSLHSAATFQPTSEKCEDQLSNSQPGEKFSSKPNSAQRSLPPLPRADIGTDLRPDYFLAWSAIDPFNTLPPSKSPRTQVLLYHAKQGILSSRLMGQLRTEWLSLAIQDAAMFHTALSHYAGNYGLAHQECDPVEALRFRMESMRLVNQRLDDIANAVGDGTLGTVASLSSYEATNGSLTAINTHMKGLQRLVALRGGLQGAINPFTKRLILWADLNCANALGSTPVFNLDSDGSPLAQIPEGMERGTCTTGNTLSQTGCPAMKTLKALNMTEDVETLNMGLKNNFTSLKQLTNIDADTTERGREEKIRNSDKLYVTERNLLILGNAWGPRKFVTAACIAATIFVDNHLRGVGFNARLIDRLVTRLQFCMNVVLNDMSRHDANNKTVKAIIWVLFVGGIAAKVRLGREWFIMQLYGFCDTLGLETYEDAELVLKDFLWAPNWQNQGQLLWMQVEEMRLLNNIVWPTADDMINTHPE
ncbi:hypothetical protein BKA64DRAFT_195574 [Cadophora sp. MPI-SDFR-AT-0126]|nr:hypothetical protein BKA64DRAFT_195574 [Leotiomycetes sp. MPI-SDFR-AT-0126]